MATYIGIINNFWQFRRGEQLTNMQADLYFALLNECNMGGWKNPFVVSNRLLCATLGIAEPSLIAARNKLLEIGLIAELEAGVRNCKSPKYKLNFNLNNLSRKRVATLDGTLDETLDAALDETLDAALDESEMKQEHIYIEDKSRENKTKKEKNINISPNGDAEAKLVAAIFKSYNKICKNLPEAKVLTENRSKIIQTRYREHGREKILKMLENAANSNFLAGQNKKGFIADFDWLFKPFNFVKVLEGKYDNNRYIPTANGASTAKTAGENTKKSAADYLEGAWERLTQQ